MKSVLISIKSKYCELIASGKKTVEIRKTRPKLETPFKCYIYCTKPSKKHQTVCGCMALNSDELYRHPKYGIKYGNSIELMLCDEGEYSKDNFLNGKVIGEFICDEISRYTEKDLFYGMDEISNSGIENYSCVDIDSLLEYKGKKEYIYGWHISNLVIYDKPKKISDFQKPCNHYNDCSTCKRFDRKDYACICGITRPPQSWCYVEEL